MRVYYQSTDYDLWLVVINEPHCPKVWVNGIKIPKPEEDKKKKISLNAKAMNIMFYALDRMKSIAYLHVLVHIIFGMY